MLVVRFMQSLLGSKYLRHNERNQPAPNDRKLEAYIRWIFHDCLGKELHEEDVEHFSDPCLLVQHLMNSIDVNAIPVDATFLRKLYFRILGHSTNDNYEYGRRAMQLCLVHLPVDNALTERDEYGYTILHTVILTAPFDNQTIDIILDRCPEAAYVRDADGRLPIHLAIQSVSPPEIVRMLGFSSTLFGPVHFVLPDSSGMLPLHLACRFNRALAYKRVEDILDMCLQQYPKALNITDNLGRLPLHVALDSGVSDAMLNMILDKCENSVFDVADKDGRLPIHVAFDMYQTERWMQRTETNRVVSLMFMNPPGLLKHDHLGRLPLHIALTRGTSEDAVMNLMQQAPSTIEAPNPRGYLPWELACHHDASVEVIFHLLQRDPGLFIGHLKHNREGVIF